MREDSFFRELLAESEDLLDLDAEQALRCGYDAAGSIGGDDEEDLGIGFEREEERRLGAVVWRGQKQQSAVGELHVIAAF